MLEYLATLSQPNSLREIAHGMGLKHHGRRFLPRVIRQLAKRGEVEEMYGGRYRLTASKTGTPPAPAFRGSETRGRAQPQQPRSETQFDSPRSAPSSKQLRDPSLISGRLVAHRDGYGFVVPDKPIPRVDGDLFIGRDNLADAMHGDRVLARVERRRADGRAEGRIVEVVVRQHPTLVGLFRYGPRENHVLPYDTRIPHEVLIPPAKN